MRLDRKKRLLALSPSEGPSSLREGQGGGKVVAENAGQGFTSLI
jgi:hypothetical protein